MHNVVWQNIPFGRNFLHLSYLNSHRRKKLLQVCTKNKTNWLTGVHFSTPICRYYWAEEIIPALCRVDVYKKRKLRLPYVRDGLFVLVVCGPHGYFVPFGAHVNDSSAHVIAVVIKGFAHQTQKLQGEQLPGKNSRLLESNAFGSVLHLLCRCVSRCFVIKTGARWDGLSAVCSPSQHTVSSQKRSRSDLRCCLDRVMSQRPPRRFRSSSHMGLIPSCGQIKK